MQWDKLALEWIVKVVEPRENVMRYFLYVDRQLRAKTLRIKVLGTADQWRRILHFVCNWLMKIEERCSEADGRVREAMVSYLVLFLLLLLRNRLQLLLSHKQIEQLHASERMG